MSRENSRTTEIPTSPEKEVIHLKRLLVTMKQKFEQTLQQMNSRIESETEQKRLIQLEVDQLRRESVDAKQRHEEEYESLIQQQNVLKELLQKTKVDNEEKLKIWQEGYFQNSQEENSTQTAPMTPLMLRRLETLEERVRQQSGLEEKYEQVRDELAAASQQLEEALEGRIAAERELSDTRHVLTQQKQHINDLEVYLKNAREELEQAQIENTSKQTLFGESETNLKIAQQHLAKKVKEVALMAEQIDSLQLHLMDHERIEAETRTHITELQNQLEISIRQEKKLQEQLHESLKSNENQTSKWEEKYFCMYDKWQESEGAIKELKKLEEKYQQMQSLLANLGSFMGSPPTPQHRMQEILNQEREANENSDEINSPSPEKT